MYNRVRPAIDSHGRLEKKMNKHLSYILPVVLVLALVFGSRWAYEHYNYLIDITLPVAAVVLVALHINIVRFITELNQKLQIKRQFGSYLSPAMVERLQKNPDLLKLGGESRELSIMFTDVRGFTSISEHYGSDVQGLTRIMNRYMTAMTAKIIENNGTLDKYIGDAQMAFWNAPLDDSEHAKNAVRTAMAMLGDLDAFNSEIEQEGVPPFGMGLGINTGTVVVGNMGSSQRFDYTCLGDAVNLASRLEGQSKPYGVKIVLGPLTAEQVRDEFTVIELDLIAVKGKTEPARIYTVIQSREPQNELAHRRFLDCYRQARWEQARTYAQELARVFNGELSKYYAMMIDRINELELTQDTQSWTGVYVATSK